MSQSIEDFGGSLNTNVLTTMIINFLSKIINYVKDKIARKKYQEELNKGIQELRSKREYLQSKDFEKFLNNNQPIKRLVKLVKDGATEKKVEELLEKLLEEAQESSEKWLRQNYQDYKDDLCGLFNYVYQVTVKFYEQINKVTYGDIRTNNQLSEISKDVNETKILVRDGIIRPNDHNKPKPVILQSIPGPSKRELTYRYKVENLPLIGRDTEMETLEAFCKEEDPFLWYALCGPGGSGKSRLAYEFARMMQTGGWEVFWLKEEECAKLSEATFKTEKPILIIADYVLMHTDAIGKFIGKMNGASTTIRLLLIERADKDLSKNQELREFPIWNALRMYSKIKTGHLEDTLYKNDQREFLFLNPLTDEALLEVIEKYAKQIPDCKKTLSTQDTKIILKRLYEVDPKYRRPLYARILVLLWANDEEWENYSVTRLMQKVLDREIDRWTKYLCEDNENSRECLLKLLAIVTMNGGMTAESLKKMYPVICDEMSKYLTKDLPAFFEDNEMIDLTSEGDSFFCSVEPDLFGEYLVLNWLTVTQNGMRDRLNILFDDKWYENTSKAQFLLRLIGDYEETITNTNKLGELFWKTVITHDITEISYWKFLAETARLDRLSLELRRNIVDSFEKSVEKNDDIRLKEVYARTLFYLHYDEDAEGKRTCIKKLENLSKKQVGNAEIAGKYADGLLSLSFIEKTTVFRSGVAKLEELHKAYEGNVEIARKYEDGLYFQCIREAVAVTRSCVAKLKELHKVYAENAEIACVYAQGLVDQVDQEDLFGARSCVAKLEELHKEYAENAEIACVYAKGLLIQCFKEDLSGARSCVAKLEELHNANEENAEIASAYAYGLVNQSIKEDLSGARGCVAKLEKLHKAYEGNAEIALEYARGLVNQSFREGIKEDLEGARRCVAKLEELHKVYAENAEIAWRYAQGLVNQSFKEDLEGARSCVAKLEELHKEYAENAEIAWRYANGLFNQSCEEDLKGARRCVAKLKDLHKEFPDDALIACVYANGLFNQSNKEDLSGARSCVAKLEELHKKFPENEEIALEYASGLVDQGAKEDLEGARSCVAKLEALHKKCPEDAEIESVYEKGLDILRTKE